MSSSPFSADDRTGAGAVRRFNEQPPWGPLPSMLGVEMLEIELELVRARIEVTERLLAGTGYLWAPVVVGLADALCAAGTGASLPEGATFTTMARAPGPHDPGVGSHGHGHDLGCRVIALPRCTQMVLYPR